MADQVSQPEVGRPVLPDGYGVPENNDGLLPWSFVEERMTAAKNYWIATANREAKPAATPVWGVWVAGKFYFDGSPETRRGRNMAENPHIAVHLESGDQVVILEGMAQMLGKPDPQVAEQVAAEYRRKYANFGYSPTPDQWDQGGLVELTAEKAIAWSQFPTDMTRWKFKE
jgi:nitroimidazol reductase NimA-like FMN-containing flavoprotein (pyridoxamine 5'-phosphate oxidase superfamily)